MSINLKIAHQGAGRLFFGFEGAGATGESSLTKEQVEIVSSYKGKDFTVISHVGSKATILMLEREAGQIIPLGLARDMASGMAQDLSASGEPTSVVRNPDQRIVVPPINESNYPWRQVADVA